MRGRSTLLFCSLLGLLAVLWVSLRQHDSEWAEINQGFENLFTKPGSQEALSWLEADSERMFSAFENGPSVSFVKDLYQYGAKRVTLVAYPNESDELGTTAGLVVDLPESPKSRGRIFRRVQAFYKAADDQGFWPVATLNDEVISSPAAQECKYILVLGIPSVD